MKKAGKKKDVPPPSLLCLTSRGFARRKSNDFSFSEKLKRHILMVCN